MNDGRRSATSTDELPPRTTWDETVVLQRFVEHEPEPRWYVRHPDDSPWPWRMLYVGVPLLAAGIFAAWWVIFR
jgi:hypothetical protein